LSIAAQHHTAHCDLKNHTRLPPQFLWFWVWIRSCWVLHSGSHKADIKVLTTAMFSSHSCCSSDLTQFVGRIQFPGSHRTEVLVSCQPKVAFSNKRNPTPSHVAPLWAVHNMAVGFHVGLLLLQSSCLMGPGPPIIISLFHLESAD
jgi:hypothetical protein